MQKYRILNVLARKVTARLWKVNVRNTEHVTILYCQQKKQQAASVVISSAEQCSHMVGVRRIATE